MKQQQESERTPQVGIIFHYADKLWIESTPLALAGTYGDFRIHEGDHVIYWDRLIEEGKVPPDVEYETVPRGRVAFDGRTKRYRLMLDRCILRNKKAVSDIQCRLSLPLEETDTITDPHYLCSRCLALLDPD